MHAIVCIKQVPDTAEVRIDPANGTLQRAGVPAIVNPVDLHAVEAAVRLRERFGGKVTAITMGPPAAVEALRECVAHGVDQAVLISDRGLAGADTLATSYTLWTAIDHIMKSEPVDILFCGKQAIDGDTGQVPPGLAVRLGWTQLTYVCAIDEIDFARREIEVRRVVEEGIEVLRGGLPAVVAVVKEINEPRYPSLPDMIRAARYQPVLYDRSVLTFDDSMTGLKGSPTIVAKVFAPPPMNRPPVEIVPDGSANPERAGELLVDKLLSSGVLKVA